jgi:hypothetical protein
MELADSIDFQKLLRQELKHGRETISWLEAERDKAQQESKALHSKLEKTKELN